MVIAYLAVVTTAVQSIGAPPAPPSAPIVATGVDTVVSRQAIADFIPGEVMCEGSAVRPVFAPAPLLSGMYSNAMTPPAPVRIKFRIDADGRALGIGQPQGSTGFYGGTSDLAPTLATWRFAPGRAQAGCSITFTPRLTSVADAPPALLHRFFALPHEGSVVDRQVSQRILAGAASCFRPKPPAVRNRAFPAFEDIAQPPGTSSYAMVGFDIDASGKPVRTRILSSDGNAALDAASVKAVQGSRFAPGARTGCNYPYHRRQNTPIAAPAAPDKDMFRKPGSTCNEQGNWALPPRLTFPEPFRRRAIEGWAIIGYDVAPWGATGNVTVLASEPAAAFGDAARSIVQQAKRPVSQIGATGCVDRVLFKLPDGNTEERLDAVTVPPPPPF